MINDGQHGWKSSSTKSGWFLNHVAVQHMFSTAKKLSKCLGRKSCIASWSLWMAVPLSLERIYQLIGNQQSCLHRRHLGLRRKDWLALPDTEDLHVIMCRFTEKSIVCRRTFPLLKIRVGKSPTTSISNCFFSRNFAFFSFFLKFVNLEALHRHVSLN